ncbi:DUF262 domain-containing protein [Burkholderia ambifaria]|uniref:DUF262 domain-containing protein n=1 Tax=Burkholderia ambifaria TaxID=152480 RepID=UPI001588709F|nr:DUF262 domain-containing protein [Burkholderia ambifaria]
MVSPAQKIFEATSESLYDFVSKNGRGLYIPPYQRDYAWDRSNVERLIDDTLQGLDALLKRPDESITFIGTIITMNDAKKTTINPLVKNQVYGQVMTVIDGQQRLTTLLMLCLALLLEIETQWNELKKSKVTVSDETKIWIETRVNDMRGLLSQMLAEKQNNGEGAFRFFPKMIRAFIDTWSYDADKAVYESPIAWLLFEFVSFREQNDPNWAKFLPHLQKSADKSAENGRILKLMKVMRAKLKALPSDEEFPRLLDIVRDTGKQETLFGEEFPSAMQEALEAILSSQSHELMVDDAGELELEVDDAKTKNWWQAATGLVSLLFFARFALERITLVVVTATTEDFAFDVFEALNTTGQPLTAIETFTPKVVQSVGLAKYNSSEEKKQLDIAFSYLKRASKAEERQKRSADLLVAFALAETGEKRSKNLAEQRRFMRESFDMCKTRPDQQLFIRHLADLSRFFDAVWVDGDSKPALGGDPLADPVALCLRFLVDIGHTITAPLLAQYAAEVTSAAPEDRATALSEFSCVVRAVTAFTILWRASRTTTDRIDSVYRDLMSKGAKEFGVPELARALRGDTPLPKASAIQAALVARLKADRGDGGISLGNKEEWIEKVIVQPLYDVNTTLARFFLLVAFHDTVEGALGQLIHGKAGVHPTLKLEAWTNKKYSTIEHIAPRSRANGWASDLYGDDQYERLGNLTLVPLNANGSLSDRPWKQKRALYGALAAHSQQEAEKVITQLKHDGIDLSETAGPIYWGEYLPHVRTLSTVPDEWNLAAVDKRGRELAALAWDRLAPWLGLGGSS